MKLRPTFQPSVYPHRGGVHRGHRYARLARAWLDGASMLQLALNARLARLEIERRIRLALTVPQRRKAS